MFKLFKKSPNLKSILEINKAENAPLFIGSKKEFNKYLPSELDKTDRDRVWRILKKKQRIFYGYNLMLKI